MNFLDEKVMIFDQNQKTSTKRNGPLRCGEVYCILDKKGAFGTKNSSDNSLEAVVN